MPPLSTVPSRLLAIAFAPLSGMELHTECTGWSGARGPLENKTSVFCAGKLSEKSRCKKKKKMVFDLEAVAAICGYHQRQLESEGRLCNGLKICWITL